ncbi:uncharacterized protein LOC133529119 [Cydia pomonella]|uniref:uncharacterized protein LOC133529119 n=1 Tax=Cydia pomonella TaxID=82600 RepID=UPI002ADE086C|nr:uncharacterized protein LOC133529119 [Cydia pomonella]
MAFYNSEIMQNPHINQAWRAAFNIEIDQNEEINISQICYEIGNYMRRSRRPLDRLSLRSASVLLSGTVRLFRDEVDRLLKDTVEICVNPVSTRSPEDRTVVSSESAADDSVCMSDAEATTTIVNFEEQGTTKRHQLPAVLTPTSHSAYHSAL